MPPNAASAFHDYNLQLMKLQAKKSREVTRVGMCGEEEGEEMCEVKRDGWGSAGALEV